MQRLTRPQHILRFRHQSHGTFPRPVRHARTLIIPSLSSAFLQLGETISTLPLPASLPPYSATIILTTIVLRSCTTLPLAIWSKHAVGRFKDNIRNDIKERQMEEARAFKAEKIKKRQPINEKTFEEFKTVVAPKMLEFQKRYIARRVISRGPIMVAPLFVNAAALITFTMTLRHLSTPPTPFSAEVFILSESSLAQTDPFGILPGAIGVMAMLNTEIRRALTPVSTSEDSSGMVGRFSRIIDSLARGLSVVIVAFAMTNPVAVQIYWLTSFMFTAFESILTTRLELIRSLASSPGPQSTLSPGGETQSSPNSSNSLRRHSRYNERN